MMDIAYAKRRCKEEMQYNESTSTHMHIAGHGPLRIKHGHDADIRRMVEKRNKVLTSNGDRRKSRENNN